MTNAGIIMSDIGISYACFSHNYDQSKDNYIHNFQELYKEYTEGVLNNPLQKGFLHRFRSWMDMQFFINILQVRIDSAVANAAGVRYHFIAQTFGEMP